MAEKLQYGHLNFFLMTVNSLTGREHRAGHQGRAPAPADWPRPRPAHPGWPRPTQHRLAPPCPAQVSSRQAEGRRQPRPLLRPSGHLPPVFAIWERPHLRARRKVTCTRRWSGQRAPEDSPEPHSHGPCRPGPGGRRPPHFRRPVALHCDRQTPRERVPPGPTSEAPGGHSRARGGSTPNAGESGEQPPPVLTFHTSETTPWASESRPRPAPQWDPAPPGCLVHTSGGLVVAVRGSGPRCQPHWALGGLTRSPLLSPQDCSQLPSPQRPPGPPPRPRAAWTLRLHGGGAPDGHPSSGTWRLPPRTSAASAPGDRPKAENAGPAGDGCRTNTAGAETASLPLSPRTPCECPGPAGPGHSHNPPPGGGERESDMRTKATESQTRRAGKARGWALPAGQPAGRMTSWYP